MNNKAREKVPTMKSCKRDIGLHFTTDHTGKMSGMISLSTSVLCNPYCTMRKNSGKSDLICAHCFSDAIHNRYSNVAKCTERNTEILTSGVIDIEKLPLINAHSFRLEAFGDIQNETQVINYFNLCQKNTKVSFALWTKNPFIIKRTIAAGNEKPKNLIVIYSSPFINKPVNLETIKKEFPFIDKVFTVWNNEKAATEKGVKINCGSRNCINCLRCYSKRTTGNINELLK